jgi:signal recognition particle subunit SRP54
MTEKERKNPKLLNASRRIRIANGSGTSVQAINKFMTSFEMTQKMMKKMKDEKGIRNVMKNLNIDGMR